QAGDPEEEPLGSADQHVAGASTDGEGGALDQGDRALHVPKRHRLALEPPRLAHRSKRYDPGPLRTRGTDGRVAGPSPDRARRASGRPTRDLLAIFLLRR